MSEIVAKRLVDHLERAGYVVMKRPLEIDAAALGREVPLCGLEVVRSPTIRERVSGSSTATSLEATTNYLE